QRAAPQALLRVAAFGAGARAPRPRCARDAGRAPGRLHRPREARAPRVEERPQPAVLAHDLELRPPSRPGAARVVRRNASDLAPPRDPIGPQSPTPEDDMTTAAAPLPEAADRAPRPVASMRHTIVFLAIYLGIAALIRVQTARPAAVAPRSHVAQYL